MVLREDKSQGAHHHGEVPGADGGGPRAACDYAETGRDVAMCTCGTHCLFSCLSLATGVAGAACGVVCFNA